MGVKLDDVRGQAEAKEEVKRIVSLWQSSEDFVAAGGKPDRGLLSSGNPGRQDVSREGDRKLVRLPVRCNPRLGLRLHLHGRRRDPRPLPRVEGQAARPEMGGQCIVFIDEIDAVGMRRASLGMGMAPLPLNAASFEDLGAFHGQWVR